MTTRTELVQKAKKLGIKNIGKKNMITLKSQITRKQNTEIPKSKSKSKSKSQSQFQTKPIF